MVVFAISLSLWNVGLLSRGGQKLRLTVVPGEFHAVHGLLRPLALLPNCGVGGEREEEEQEDSGLVKTAAAHFKRAQFNVLYLDIHLSAGDRS